jgi:hypothetical protein
VELGGWIIWATMDPLLTGLERFRGLAVGGGKGGAQSYDARRGGEGCR